MPSDHSEEVIPVPIPNTEVKLFCANDTVAKRESKLLLGFLYFKSFNNFYFYLFKGCRNGQSFFCTKNLPL